MQTHCELAIVSDEISPDFLTGELHIVPERTFRKGEQFVSKHSGSIITKPHNLWAIKSKPSELEEETISHHIEYFKSVFSTKIGILKKIKEDTRFEITFWIWIETDNAGIGFVLKRKQKCRF
ncbi:MAG: DUF4279 domain-containing protein [Bacteroidetes bacterium]|nr:DUF4279 domain-containing protein [Bacteroidota bacterium]